MVYQSRPWSRERCMLGLKKHRMLLDKYFFCLEKPTQNKNTERFTFAGTLAFLKELRSTTDSTLV